MSKKQAKPIPAKTVTDKKPENEPKEAPKKVSGKIGIIKNMLLLFVSLFIVTMLFRENDGYNWLWNGLVHENMKFISRNGNLTAAQKLQSKFGLDASVIDYIKSVTPDTAVILMPPGAIIINDSSQYKFMRGLGGMKSKLWTLDLLYPRRLVYEDEKEKNPFKNSITHILLLNGWGYNLLQYDVLNKTDLEIRPIKMNR